MHFAEIILPVAVSGADSTYTYHIPPTLQERVAVGSRVAVPLGLRKHYAGIVLRLTDEPPQGVQMKDIADVLDDPSAPPTATAVQLQLWRWMADYYMCTLGEVMKAALPAGLKLESEMQVVRNPDFDDFSALTDRDLAVLDRLTGNKPIRLQALEKLCGANVLPAVRRLLESGAVSVEERLRQAWRPKTERRVALCEPYTSADRLAAMLDQLQRTPRQERTLLNYLQLAEAEAAFALSNPQLLKPVTVSNLLHAEGSSGFALSALRGKGVLQTYDAETTPTTAAALPDQLRHPLSAAQQKAADAIRQTWHDKDVCLLHGVTSSGKTQVYIHLIEEALREGRQVLYLVPEIALTTQLTTRLRKAFGQQLGVYHSRLSDAERTAMWRRQLTADALPVVLGARSSLFLPFRRLGLIIVDEEHDTSYKQTEPAPRYNGRDTALVLARLSKAKVLLGTATPAFETYANALSGKYGLARLNQRFGNVQMPEIIVEDTKELRRKKLMRTPLSPRLIDEIRTTLQNGEQVILFQNRRGYSPMLECHTCGWTPRCQRCDVPLTYHHQQHRLVCHYCGTAYDVPLQCPACEGTELRDIGYGTEKIEAAAHSLFPEARTERLDLDTTRSRSAYERIIADFSAGNTDILIGTQMVTKGLDFDRVRVVGILNADQAFNQATFRAHERAFQMLSQVAGRAGRRDRRGLVVLQTGQPDLPIVAQVQRAGYAALYAAQCEERRTFGYPPFTRLVEIVFRHRDERICADAARKYADSIRPFFGADLLGPDRPAVGRIQGLHIRKLLLKVRPELPAKGVRRTLLSARNLLLTRPELRGTAVIFDADPA